MTGCVGLGAVHEVVQHVTINDLIIKGFANGLIYGRSLWVLPPYIITANRYDMILRATPRATPCALYFYSYQRWLNAL